MRSDDEALLLEGPASNPVLYGVARGLADLLPPLGPRTCHSDETRTEGQKISHEVETDRKTGKQSAAQLQSA